MFYEMQFKSGKLSQFATTDYSPSSVSFLNNLDNAAIIFDDSQNCLFLNSAAEKILGDRLNDISLIGDWIRSKIEYIVQESIVVSSKELPSILVDSCTENLDNLEVLVSKLDVSDELWQELHNRESVIMKNSYAELGNASAINSEKSNSSIIYDSNYDTLTGLPNYNLLFAYIEQEICFARQQPNYEFTILFIDINRFKVINSSLGRILGDRLLVAVSRRLQDCLRSHDFIARMGNDEFAILLSNVEHLEYATNVAERIYRELCIPFNLGGYEVFIEASIGIAPGN